MNDEFLTELREAPRREFSDALYARLAQEKQEARRIGRVQIAVVVLFAIALPLAVTMALSPAARAATQRIIQTIGSLKFDVSDEYPGGNGPVTIFASEQMTFEQARAALPFALKLPTWVPDGYTLEETVSVTQLPDGNVSALVTWLGHKNRLSLHIYAADTLKREGGIAVGPASVEEVQINERTAALVHGAWNANAKEWGPDMLISLLWTDDEQGYMLLGMEQHISAAELIRMAESMQ